jgi:hypothetical protein
MKRLETSPGDPAESYAEPDGNDAPSEDGPSRGNALFGELIGG